MKFLLNLIKTLKGFVTAKIDAFIDNFDFYEDSGLDNLFDSSNESNDLNTDPFKDGTFIDYLSPHGRLFTEDLKLIDD